MLALGAFTENPPPPSSSRHTVRLRCESAVQHVLAAADHATGAVLTSTDVDAAGVGVLLVVQGQAGDVAGVDRFVVFGEDLGDEFAAAAHIDLAEDRFEVVLDGVGG